MTELLDTARTAATDLARRRTGAIVALVADGETAVAAAGNAMPDAVCEIGSVTKVFTALALARLVDAGQAGLDEPLEDLLGSPVPSRNGQHITLRHLATHTSGLPRLPRGMPNVSRANPYAGCTAEFLLDSLSRGKLRSAPGKKVRYSNFGAGLLGLALSRRSGLAYDELVRSQVTAPLGMTSTGPDVPLTVQGHDRRRRPVGPWDLAALAGAGALRSTAADLATFLRAQLNPAGTGLEAAIALTRGEHLPFGPGSFVHLGWFRNRTKQGFDQYWHNGATGGFTCFAAFAPERGTAVAVLTPTQRPADRVALGLLGTLDDSARTR